MIIKAITKNTKIILALVLIVAVVLFTMWAVNKHQNEKMYEEGIAKLFDESMEASYPLLKNMADALYVRANISENNARLALQYSQSDDEFNDMFIKLNRYDYQTRGGQMLLYISSMYSDFSASIPFGRLLVGGELRQRESSAFIKIEFARQRLRDWEEIPPDSVVKMCQDVKVSIDVAIREIERYSKPYQDINAWRDIRPDDMIELQRKYEARKNWPFTFLN